jgi:hypothetical protein
MRKMRRGDRVALVEERWGTVDKGAEKRRDGTDRGRLITSRERRKRCVIEVTIQAKSEGGGSVLKGTTCVCVWKESDAHSLRWGGVN